MWMLSYVCIIQCCKQQLVKGSLSLLAALKGMLAA